MKIFQHIFQGNKIDCPRCLGKGYVDQDDIKRLKKELKWAPGSCAYCNGSGKVSKHFENKIAVDTSYLTSDLSSAERKRLISGDEQAVSRGIQFEKFTDDFIAQIKFLHSKGNMPPEEITEFFLITENAMSDKEKDELRDYIVQVLEDSSKV